MFFAVALTAGFILFVWLVFFKLRWLKFNIAWAIVAVFVFIHVLLIFLIGLRFVTPYSSSARVVQHTIQLVPRLPEPTLVTAVLVEPGARVKKGQPLFQFDRRPYEDKLRRAEAQLAAAIQHVEVLNADVTLAIAQATHAKASLAFQDYWLKVQKELGNKGVIAVDQLELAVEQQQLAQAAYGEALAGTVSARAKAASEIEGVNTTVAALEAERDLARFYLENTKLAAPEDGVIYNLQVRPGMVVGMVRAGAIASFICDADRYLLATFYQENLKFVKEGQPVEIALDLYPGQIFPGRVEAIWRASGAGQYLPSGTLPDFEPQAPGAPQGQYAVKVGFEGDPVPFTIGAQGAAAIYTGGMHGGWAALRRIGIRADSWFNWLYPLPF